MGCTIIGVVERRVNGAWERYDYEFPGDRNYDVFAILADVRNGLGFAAVKTSDGFEPISLPRGLPVDGTMGLENDPDRDLFHSGSWLTLREILEYDWLKKTTHTGFLDVADWLALERERRYRKKLLDGGDVAPQGSRSPQGASFLVLSENDARVQYSKELEGGKLDHEAAAHVRVESLWTTTYLHSAKAFLGHLVPLIRLGMDDVRLVFFFYG
jgi:hypothetical protein